MQEWIEPLHPTRTDCQPTAVHEYVGTPLPTLALPCPAPPIRPPPVQTMELCDSTSAFTALPSLLLNILAEAGAIRSSRVYLAISILQCLFFTSQLYLR